MAQMRWIFVTLLMLLQRNWLAEAQAPVITQQPSDTYASKGGIAELKCEAVGNDPLKYKWFHNGHRVQTSDRRRILSNGHLYIKRILHKKKKGISDTGRYYCSVTDSDGKVTKSKVVNITLGHLRKDFRVNPATQSISRGSELMLTCMPPRGKPKPKVRWLKDDIDLNVDGIRILLQERSQKLVIKNFDKEDEGDYKCAATNVAGRRLSNPATITSTVPPKIVFGPRSRTVDLSVQSQVTLSCKADGEPTPTISWKKEGNNTILPSTDGKLMFTDLKPRHKGKYMCIAHNSEGNATATADLILHYIPEFAIVSPNVNQMEGSTVKLKCLANSEPYPAIYWRKSTARSPYAIDHRYGHIQTKRDDRTIYLIFQPLKLSDAGNYTCEARNRIGTSKRDVTVAVYRKSQYPPSIVTPFVKISADINSNVTIICDVDGNPKPLVKWSKDGQDRGLRDGVIFKDEPLRGKKRRYSLVISKVQLSNSGTFQCTASNMIKEVSKVIFLQVSRKLHLSQAISSGVPSMPKNVVVVEYNDKSVRISWDHSDDPVLVYAVGYINVDERSNEQYATYDVAPNAGQYVIKGLKPNTRYMFFVRGINKTGRGVPSLLSDVIRTQTAAPTSPSLIHSTVSKPQTKLTIRLNSAGPGELDVSWEKIDEGDKIDGFYIYWKVKGSKADFQKETLQNSDSTGYKISDLQNSTKYSVRVQVFKKEVKGPVSKVVHHRTSYKPVRLMMSVTQNDSDSMTVTWKRLWKKNSGEDTLKTYYVWFTSSSQERRRKRESQGYSVPIPASAERYHYIIGNLNAGDSYNVWMSVTTALGRQYKSTQQTITLRTPVVAKKRSTMDKIKEFIIQPWFLGVLGGVILILISTLLLCCLCRRSSSKKNGDNLSIQLQERNKPETVRKASEGPCAETDLLSPASRTRESLSECAEGYDGRSGSAVYRCSGSPRTPTRSNLDFPNIAITPNKYEGSYRSLEARENDNVSSGRQARKYSENDFDMSSRYSIRSRNPYSPAPRPSVLNVDNHSDYDNAIPKCESTPEPAARSPTRSPYPGEAPPDYETAIAENLLHEENNREKKTVRDKDPRVNHMDGMRCKHNRYGSPSSRQASCSPGSECSNQGSSIAGRRKGLKPPPRLTIASVNWADMLPPPPSHPPPSSVATRSPPPSPTGTSMCSETTYGRSHASSFLPRRSGSVVSADMASDLEKETADSVRSGKSKGKSENKLPFDLAGITSDIIMQWADSVTNTSGSEDESPCSSPDRRSGISSDGSFLTDTDFANAVKAAAECGGFNIDIDLNMYKAMDPISFQPFAGSLSTYNPETSGSIKPPSKKAVNASRDGDGLRDSSRGRRARSEISRDTTGNLPSVKENSPYVSSSETRNNKNPRNVNETVNNGSTGYVPALTRTSALGKLEPANRGAVKKKYAVVRTLPQVQTEDNPDYTSNYPSHSLSSSTSNASTIRSSSCPPLMLTDEDTEDDVI